MQPNDAVALIGAFAAALSGVLALARKWSFDVERRAESRYRLLAGFLEASNAECRKQNEALERQNTALERQNEALARKVDAQAARIDALEFEVRRKITPPQGTAKAEKVGT